MFDDQCRGKKACYGFFPTDEDLFEYEEPIIEEGRKEFYDEWQTYISEKDEYFNFSHIKLI